MKSATISTKTNGARFWQQSRKHSYGRTRLPNYHDSAANVANSAVCSNCVAANGPIATFTQIHSVSLLPNP